MKKRILCLVVAFAFGLISTLAFEEGNPTIGMFSLLVVIVCVAILGVSFITKKN